MAAKYTFRLESRERRRELPGKILIAQHDTETVAHVVLKMLAYLLFFRERLQIEGDPQNDAIPFTPDLLQLDYEMRPRLWVECGECSVSKLDKLAVKVPEAEIWVVKPSRNHAEQLMLSMAKHDLRRKRYHLLALDPEMFNEVCGLLVERNQVVWFGGQWDPGQMQFEFNGLWFDAPFSVLRF